MKTNILPLLLSKILHKIKSLIYMIFHYNHMINLCVINFYQAIYKIDFLFFTIVYTVIFFIIHIIHIIDVLIILIANSKDLISNVSYLKAPLKFLALSLTLIIANLHS